MWVDAARCPHCRALVPEKELARNTSGLCNYCDQRKAKVK